MFARSYYFLACVSMLGSVYAASENANNTTKSTKNAESEDKNIKSEYMDGFLNIKTAHERDNSYPFGPKNSSAIGLTPVFSIGDFLVENDLFYGRMFTFSGPLRGVRNLSKITGEENRAYFYENFNKKLKKDLDPSYKNALDRAHFYRNYSRIIYTDKLHNFRAVAGDTTVRNTIGFQQALSGGGVSIFRQEGDGRTINAGSPIVITRVSKIECKIDDEVVAVQIFAPGVYSIDDLPEEAKLPGVTLKLNDQLNRTEVLKVDYFGGYGMLASGRDDFDLTVVCNHKWDLEDPHRIGYKKKPNYSGNYRYGYADDVTLGVGLQANENSCLLDYAMIFATEFGKIAPNVAYSDDRRGSKRAAGAGIFYALPENDLGIYFETFVAVKGTNFGDLGKKEEQEHVYNEFMDKCFSDDNIKKKLRNSNTSSSTRQITTRLSMKPVWGITSAFIFNGEWSRNQGLREYTMSFTKKIFECCLLTLSSGLTYDDPYRGRNLKSPDRRFTAICTIKIGTELSTSGSYQYYDEEKRRSFATISYTPDEIKGLELCAEKASRPGCNNPVFSIKYDCEFFNLKAEESVTNTYEDKEGGTSNKHSNRQRFYAGTSLSKDGFGAFRKSNFNVLRGVKE